MKILFKNSLILAVLTFSLQSQASKILFLGDSHVAGPFGHTLDKLLRESGENEVQSFGVCGSIARSFLKTPRTTCGYFEHLEKSQPFDVLKGQAPNFTKMVENFKPDTIIIELGSNYGTDFTEEEMQKDMSALVKKVADLGSKCFWVTMPDTRLFKKIQPTILEATLKAVSPDCKMIDSTLLTQYPETGGDGLHYEGKNSIPIAIDWAKKVFDQLN